MILRKYVSDFGMWYVQAALNGVRLELSFDHDTDDAEVLEIMTEYTKPEETLVELVGENGQII